MTYVKATGLFLMLIAAALGVHLVLPSVRFDGLLIGMALFQSCLASAGARL